MLGQAIENISKKFQKALACYAELNHMFQLELLPISMKL
jgi:hypothetical protein